MESEDTAICAAGRLIKDATPEYMVKLMQFGAEYALSPEQRGTAEQIAVEISRDGRVRDFIEDFANRIEQEPGLDDFAARIRGFFLNDSRYAHLFETDAESTEKRSAEPSGRLTPGAILTVFIVIYAASVTMLCGITSSVFPETTDQRLAAMFTLMPWALSFPIAGSVALYFAKLLGGKKHGHQ